MPDDWLDSPRFERAVEAADHFDSTHAQRAGNAERNAVSIDDAKGCDSSKAQRRLERSLLGLQSNRYTVQPLRLGAVLSPRYSARLSYDLAGDRLGGPWQPHEKESPDAVKPGVVLKKPWRIEDSIWASRRKYSDSGTYWDTSESMMRALEADLALACTGGGIERLVERHHTAETAPGAGVPTIRELMEQVKIALWAHNELLYVVFDLYAAIGVGDFSHIQPNAFKQLLDDCNLIEAGDGLNAGVWDGLFVAINANRIEGEVYNHKKALNRQEFVSFLVRAAALRHITNGRFIDVPAAIEQLLAVDVLPRVRRAVPSLAPPNEFRNVACYQEETSNVLLRHASSLKHVYEVYAYGDGAVGDKLVDRKLLGFEEWQELIGGLGWTDGQFTEREAGLCFILARMRVAVEKTTPGRAKLLQLSFEDFLEALVRVAVTKALPTDDECKAAVAADGGELMMRLHAGEQSVLVAFVDAHDVAWGVRQVQRPDRAVHHLVTWMLRRIDGKPSGPTSDLKLTAQEVKIFKKGSSRSQAVAGAAVEDGA